MCKSDSCESVGGTGLHVILDLCGVVSEWKVQVVVGYALTSTLPTFTINVSYVNSWLIISAGRVLRFMSCASLVLPSAVGG